MRATITHSMLKDSEIPEERISRASVRGHDGQFGQLDCRKASTLLVASDQPIAYGQ